MGVAGWLGVAATAIVGTALGLLSVRSTVCCASGYTVFDGYPLPLRGHHVTSENPFSQTHLHLPAQAK